MTITENHTTGHICVDCLMLEANGDLPPEMTKAERAGYLTSIENHPNASLEMTLGHLHDSPDANCCHAGEDCQDDCDCTQNAFATMPCDMCGSHLAGYREDVTFWWSE